MAEKEYTIDELRDMLHSKYLYDRVMAAQQGFGLAMLVNDESAVVRREVARHGVFLQQLAFDDDGLVREAVAAQGYGLDRLCSDLDEDVELTVHEYLRERGLSLSEWVVANPEKCVNLENKVDMQGGPVFTDREHRILLSALSREMKVCEQVDAENKNSVHPLVPVVQNINDKVYMLQHPEARGDLAAGVHRSKMIEAALEKWQGMSGWKGLDAQTAVELFAGFIKGEQFQFETISEPERMKDKDKILETELCEWLSVEPVVFAEVPVSGKVSVMEVALDYDSFGGLDTVYVAYDAQRSLDEKAEWAFVKEWVENTYPDAPWVQKGLGKR